MNKATVTAARECLDRAKAALTAMEGADSLDKMEAAWTDFLTMTNRIYNMVPPAPFANNALRNARTLCVYRS
jgi:hypothetical protein